MDQAVSDLIARSNRLGADPRNTNYAGGNTSAKGSATDPVTGGPVELLWVKGSGGDLGTLTEPGLAVLRLDRLRALAEVATDGLTPDLSFVLDVPVEAGLARKAPGDVTRFEAEFDLAFHGRVRDGFLAIARSDPGRVVVIDATDDIDTVAAAIAAEADHRLGRRSEPGPARVRNQ